MTARQMLEALLIELNKVNAPSLLLEDYNYFINKAINQYINKLYNLNEINLQYTDNMRVLKSTAILTPRKSESYKSTSVFSRLHGSTYEIDLPGDYLHILNCICFYEVSGKYKCYEGYWQAPAKRLSADSWSNIVNDYYNRPTYKRPYYYIHNVNTQSTLPTNPYSASNPHGTDFKSSNIIHNVDDGLNQKKEAIVELLIHNEISISDIKYTNSGDAWDHQLQTIDVERTYEACKTKVDSYISTSGNVVSTEDVSTTFPKTINVGGIEESTVDRNGGIRFGNPLPTVRCEIRYGADDSVFKLKEVLVDYIKVPQYVCITQEQMDLTRDTSQIMEFPDYVCQEIINELVHIVMENGSDQRLQTHNAVSLSIASPAQQLAAK